MNGGPLSHLILLPALPGAFPLPGGVQVFGAPGAQIGDKAMMLSDHADQISAAGFAMPPRVVFADDRINMILNHEEYTQSLRDSEWGGWVEMPSQIEGEIAAVSGAIRDSFGDIPVLVRSSGIGDARGIGVYRSRKTRNEPERIKRDFANVLESYLSRDGRMWREAAGVPDGFAIIVEPMVGQLMPPSPLAPHVRHFAPLISGMGYSSTGFGPGFIKIGYGCGGGRGSRLNRAVLAAYDYSAKRYLEADGETFLWISSVPYTDNPNEDIPAAEIARDELSALLGDVSYEPIFDGLASLEASIGEPVYAEWAVHAPEGKRRHYLTQFAVVPQQKDKWEFGTVDSPLFRMDDVRRGQDLEIGAAVFIRDEWNLDNLAEFNADNSAYLLIYGRDVMGSPTLGLECPLKMGHVSNAAAMMMEPHASVESDWEEHLRGLSESVNIMIGRGKVNRGEHFLGDILTHFDLERGLLVYRRPMLVRYSSSTGTAVVTPR